MTQSGLGPGEHRFGDVSVVLEPSGVATVEIQRPPANFFDVELIGALADACEALGQGDCRAIVLCAQGRHFCAGADFSGGRTGAAGDAPFTIATLYEQAARLFRAPVPIVAAVHGAAIGGGLGLACAADFRVLGPRARLSANFARLGFHQGFALTLTLPAIVGRQRALDLLYTGRRVDGEEALRIGLADRLVPDEDVRVAAHELAGQLARSAPLAVRSIRATMREPLLEQLTAALARESSEQERLRVTVDFREGVRASAERREPIFEGR
jgi:enoyl-CoA hydratase/carnithine racemase